MSYEGYLLLLSSKRRKKENIYYENKLKYKDKTQLYLRVYTYLLNYLNFLF